MIGRRLAQLRRARGISQKELGEAVMVSAYTISSYELDRSDPNDEIKVRLAEYFNVSLDYLVGLIDEPYSFRREDGVLRLPRSLDPGQQEVLRSFFSSLESPSEAPARGPKPGSKFHKS